MAAELSHNDEVIMARKHKSVFDKALGERRNKRVRKGLMGAYESTSRRSKKGRDLSNYLNLGKSKKKKHRGDWRISRAASRSLSNRMSPTERQEAERVIENELKNDRSLSNKVADETVTGNENFLRRLVSLVRERLSIWGKP
jgi:hypothetical protein